MLLVMRTNEILWGLPRGALVGEAAAPDDQALLCSRLVRAYSRDPVGGAAGFATLVRSTIPVEQLRAQQPGDRRRVRRASRAATGRCRSASPRTRRSRPRRAPVERPAGRRCRARRGDHPGRRSRPRRRPPRGNALTPGALHAVLQALGSPTSAEEVAIAWYRAHAARHLVPFPTRPRPRRSQELLAGLEPWEVGDDLSAVDWTGTVTASPVVVPGITTVRRAYLDDPDESVEVRPVDLDLYLDSSGSMPDPRRNRAPIALAGAILALSALRAGAQRAGHDVERPEPGGGDRRLHARRGRGPAGRRRVLRRFHRLPARPAAPDPPRRPGGRRRAHAAWPDPHRRHLGLGRRHDVPAVRPAGRPDGRARRCARRTAAEPWCSRSLRTGPHASRAGRTATPCTAW